MPIFVDTDHGPKNKLYDGSMSGSFATAAEGKMQSMVVAQIAKAPAFTTTQFPKAKGYAIRLAIAKFDNKGPDTICRLDGSITRWPKQVVKAGTKGDAMVSLGWTGGAQATGTKVGSLLDCIDAIVESMMKIGIPAMQKDFPKW